MKFLALSFSLLSPWVWSADEYRIDYQIERLNANGVTTIQKYSEKIIRDEQNIWIERLNTQTMLTKPRYIATLMCLPKQTPMSM